MRSLLAIDISAGMLRVTLCRPAGRTWLHKLYAVLRGRTEFAVIATQAVYECHGASHIVLGIQQACTELKKRYAEDFQRPEVRVEIGAAYAKVAVIDKPSFDPKEWADHVGAWQQWNWGKGSGKDIASHVQWGDNKLLISSVQREMFDALCTFCKDQRMTFTSCRPAIVSIIERLSTTMPSEKLQIVGITEFQDAQKAGNVQWMCISGESVQSVHRMWLASDSPQAWQAAACRVRANHPSESPAQWVTQHWPQVPAIGSLHG